MNKIRKKLLDFKHRLSDRKMFSITITMLCMVMGWGLYQYNRADDYRHQIDSTYNRAFFELLGSVQNVETLLLKSLVSTAPSRTAQSLKEVWRQAYMAQENLGILPISQPVLANTSKFLTQVGDLSQAFSNQNLNGLPLTAPQYKMLENLNHYAYTLKNSLYGLQEQITTGRIKWGELSEKGSVLFSNASSNLPLQEFETLEKTFKDLPTLIYDGPFSDHLISNTPKGLSAKEIDLNKAKEIALNFKGKNEVFSIDEGRKDELSTIKTFNFNIKPKNSAKNILYSIAVTERGGHVLWMLHNRPLGPEKTKIDTASKKALEFLSANGFVNMSQTYYLKENGVATINFAFKKENITIYADLIKVKVALDNSEIVGFEAKGYYTAHFNRAIPRPKISLEVARGKINPLMQINSFGLAMIPTEFKTEILCYEFKGRINNRDFLVYGVCPDT